MNSDQNSSNYKMLSLVYLSYLCLAFFLFTSLTLSALHHILILIPAIIFAFKPGAFKPYIRRPSFILLLSLFFWCIITVIANADNIENPIRNILKLKYFFIALISIPAVDACLKNYIQKRHCVKILNFFLVAATVATISGLVAYFFGYNPIKMKDACHPTRTCGMYGMYMTYAYGLSFFLSVVIGLWLKKEVLKKFISIRLLYTSLFINLIGFVLSFARGAYLGLIFSVPFYFFKANKKTFSAVAGVLILLLSLSILFIPKINSMFTNESRIESIKTRIAFYQAAIAAAKEKPLFGFGFRNFEVNSGEIKKRNNIPYTWHKGHAHSNFFEHLASTGWIGLILCLLFHLAWIYEAYQRSDLFGFILFPTLVNFFISGQAQYTFGDGENLFFIMAIFMLSHCQNLTNEK